MDTEKTNKASITKEKVLNEQINNSLSPYFNLEEQYSKLYSDFNVKERKYDFWEVLNKKYKNNKIESNNLHKIHHILNYRNYKIIDKSDFSYNNNNFNYYNNKKNNNNINHNYHKIKKGRNKTTFNYNKQGTNNSLENFKNLTCDCNLDTRKVYNRLYNRGFYIKNKIILNKIKDEETLSKTFSNNHPNLNPQKKRILLNRNNFSNKTNKHKHNKSLDYYRENLTFKPNIDKNSIRIIKKMKNKKICNDISLAHSFNCNKNKFKKIKYDIFKENYKNLYDYIKNSKYSYFNESLIKSESQRIICLRKRNIENYKIKTDNEVEKNNDEHNKIKNNEKINPFHVYENNKKWKKLRDDKVEENKKIKENIEMFENRKELQLPGKENYEKYKNLIIKIFSPKQKPNKYALLQKKNITNDNKNNSNIEINEINNNKKEAKSSNKNIINSKYHRQKLKYINNEGKELYLYEPYLNNENYLNKIPRQNNINFGEFTKIVQESKINIKDIKININDKNKVKKYNKLKLDKNSLEYKVKNIKNVFSTRKKNKNK